MKMMLEDKGIICKNLILAFIIRTVDYKKKDNTEYKVFTPFYNAFQKQVIPKPISKVQSKMGKPLYQQAYLFQNYTCCQLYRGHLILNQYGAYRGRHTKHSRNFSLAN